MKISSIKIGKLKPYKKNNKKHDQTQIDNVAESIKQYGFVQPIVADKNNVVVIGHCRLLAAKHLGMKEVPCVCVDDLTDEQVRKLRIVDNKTNESEWDFANLELELPDLDFSDFDFDFGFDFDDEGEAEQADYETRIKEFHERMESGELSEDDEEYQEFLAKFEAKKTTDDCYTPPIVYEAVADYVAERYGVSKDNFVRPFFPNGDYQAEKYKPTDIVVDNPPFSIMAEILNYYSENGIKFFLFAPHLTIFSSSAAAASSCLICGVSVTYENGANVNTSFVTNMEDCAFRSAPKLYKAVKTANDENLKSMRRELPKYSYPMNVITSPMITNFSRYGIDFEVAKDECHFIRQLESQKESGKGLFGSGYLISDKKKAEREKAEREKNGSIPDVWELSERELAIIRSLK